MLSRFYARQAAPRSTYGSCDHDVFHDFKQAGPRLFRQPIT